MLARYMLSARKIIQPFKSELALISTTKKSKEGAISYPEDLYPKKTPPPPVTPEDFANTKNIKSWYSYGFNEEDYEDDRIRYHLACFSVLTVMIGGCTFIFWYAPDYKEQDWYYREAYLELHRRERLGLPLIDKNYIDPELIDLPSDEELGDTEVTP